MVNTWKIVSAALAIFATGVLTGALSVGVAGSVAKRKAPDRKPRAEVALPALPAAVATAGAEGARRDLPPLNLQPPGAARMEVLRRIDRDLKLTPTQHERLGQLIDGTEKRLREIWEPVAPEAQTAVRELRRRIKDEVLTPEQRPAFDKFLRNRSNSDRPTARRPVADPVAPSPTPAPQ